MSQHGKLEQILSLLVNEESEKAEELLHILVVEKARSIYEEIVNGEDEEDEDCDDAVDEAFGGDPKADFVSDIETAKSDIETDELYGGEADEEPSDEFGDEEPSDDFGDEEPSDESVGEKMDELSVQIAELRALFDEIIQGELEEPGHEPEDFEIDDEGTMAGHEYEDPTFGSIEEATQFQDTVADPGMNKEGKHVGTGKNSKIGATGTAAPYTKSPTKSLNGEDSVDFTKGGDEAGASSVSSTNTTPTDNIDENPSAVSRSEQKSEGEFVGTGKNSKKGAVNTKSPLSTAPKKP